jgi:glutathione synthase/RimK-type ligase-like ATP-grasp enzyme
LDEAIDLSLLTSAWYRRPQFPVPHQEITDPFCRDYLIEESKTYLNDVWNALDCPFLPATPSLIRRAELKASQLKAAAALGFELPPTLFTNSPEEFLEFYRQHNGNIVSKLPSVTFQRFGGSTFARYTQVVSKRDVGYATALRFCPVIFQAYVPKLFELRITVVGKQVFAAEIHSQQANHTRHDWRRYDNYKTPHLPHQLPCSMEQRCVHLVEQLGLCYGAIDMVVTPDGRYVFLEINPNGQYLWIEETTGLPISDAICDLLMSGIPANKPKRIFELPPEDYNEPRVATAAARCP